MEKSGAIATNVDVCGLVHVAQSSWQPLRDSLNFCEPVYFVSQQLMFCELVLGLNRVTDQVLSHAPTSPRWEEDVAWT